MLSGRVSIIRAVGAAFPMDKDRDTRPTLDEFDALDTLATWYVDRRLAGGWNQRDGDRFLLGTPRNYNDFTMLYALIAHEYDRRNGGRAMRRWAMQRLEHDIPDESPEGIERHVWHMSDRDRQAYLSNLLQYSSTTHDTYPIECYIATTTGLTWQILEYDREDWAWVERVYEAGEEVADLVREIGRDSYGLDLLLPGLMRHMQEVFDSAVGNRWNPTATTSPADRLIAELQHLPAVASFLQGLRRSDGRCVWPLDRKGADWHSQQGLAYLVDRLWGDTSPLLTFHPSRYQHATTFFTYDGGKEISAKALGKSARSLRTENRTVSTTLESLF